MTKKIRMTVLGGLLGVGAMTLGSFTPASADPIGANTLYIIGGTGAGRAEFDNYGEHLAACDTASGGGTVKATLTVAGTTYSVSDPDGAGGACGRRDLSITDGQSGVLRLYYGSTLIGSLGVTI